MKKHLLKKLGYYYRRERTDLLSSVGLPPHKLHKAVQQRILLYHGIDELGRTDINARFLSAEKFEQQLDYYLEHFHIVSLQAFQQGKFSTQRPTIALTFDDGYKNNIDLAIPILERKGIPATFFVTAIDNLPYPMLWTDYLDLANLLLRDTVQIGGQDFHWFKGEFRAENGRSLKAICKEQNWSFKKQLYHVFPHLERRPDVGDLIQYWQPMSSADIQTISDHPLFEIGVHAYYHEDLANCPVQEASHLLRQAKAYVESVCGKQINTLAYANGSYTKALLDEAEAMGFEYQFAVDYQHSADKADPRINDRLTINPFVSIHNQVRAIYTNRY